MVDDDPVGRMGSLLREGLADLPPEGWSTSPRRSVGEMDLVLPQKPLVLVADQLDLGEVVVALDPAEVVDVCDVEGHDPARNKDPGALFHDRVDVLPVFGIGHALSRTPSRRSRAGS